MDAHEEVRAFMTDPVLQQRLAKYLVLQCFRNSMLEDLHAGISPSSASGDYSDVTVSSPYGAIFWPKVSRLNDDEMKCLMIDVVDQTYHFIHTLFDENTGGELLLRLAHRDPPAAVERTQASDCRPVKTGHGLRKAHCVSGRSAAVSTTLLGLHSAPKDFNNLGMISPKENPTHLPSVHNMWRRIHSSHTFSTASRGVFAGSAAGGKDMAVASLPALLAFLKFAGARLLLVSGFAFLSVPQIEIQGHTSLYAELPGIAR